MEKRKPCALTGVRTTIYMYIYDYRSNFRMPSYKFLIVATSEWLDLLRRPCYFIPLYVITMLRCVSFETAHSSKSCCCCTATKHMAVNRASDSVLLLWKYYCRFGVIIKYPLRIRYGILTRLQAGRTGIRIPAEGKLVFFFPKLLDWLYGAVSPLTVVFSAEKATGSWSWPFHSIKLRG
jgi:hypothetical protein